MPSAKLALKFAVRVTRKQFKSPCITEEGVTPSINLHKTNLDVETWAFDVRSVMRLRGRKT
ncbi:CLUMA_CG010483, isoform A [Clunio marinus]|uniref:CLUMA_CG010483, isoform A n=1 Tax=Clunio marinus TaxID=568069 RepID=A0A1J1I9W0_9DIPT|nr:CLUMA_CG010483, isoform A [Clunio marinus]